MKFDVHLEITIREIPGSTGRTFTRDYVIDAVNRHQARAQGMRRTYERGDVVRGDDYTIQCTAAPRVTDEDLAKVNADIDKAVGQVIAAVDEVRDPPKRERVTLRTRLKWLFARYPVIDHAHDEGWDCNPDCRRVD